MSCSNRFVGQAEIRTDIEEKRVGGGMSGGLGVRGCAKLKGCSVPKNVALRKGRGWSPLKNKF